MSADQRSLNTEQDMADVFVTVDGELYAKADIYLSGGTVTLSHLNDGELHTVVIEVRWLETSETLWKGFVQS